MPTWYLNPALTRFRAAVDVAWPNRDRASDGTIGNEAHQATVSDHNPDPDGSVDAWDMDVDGVPVEHLKTVFQSHESALYWIHNDQIARRAGGWKREPYANYAGPVRNRHERHVHWNTRQSHENSTAPWEVDDMPTVDEIWAKQYRDRLKNPDGSETSTVGELLMAARVDAFRARAEAAAIRVALDGIVSGDADTAAILAGMDERLAALRTQLGADTRDTVADGLEGGATAVRNG